MSWQQENAFGAEDPFGGQQQQFGFDQSQPFGQAPTGAMVGPDGEEYDQEELELIQQAEQRRQARMQ